MSRKITNRNIYTNNRLNDGRQDKMCFSYDRPLSAQQPYQQRTRSPNNYLRSSHQLSMNIKPLKAGIYKPPSEQNTNLYFNQQQHQQKLQQKRSLPKPKQIKAQKNIYLSRNINTAYGKGHFKANYQGLFGSYGYQSDRSTQSKQKKDVYTKYKQKKPFVAANRNRVDIQQNTSNHSQKKVITDPYRPIDEDNMFRAKSPQGNKNHKFQWKPTTQFVTKKYV